MSPISVIREKSNLISFVLSALATMFLGYAIKDSGEWFTYSNSFITIPVLIGGFLSIRSFGGLERRTKISSLVVGFFFAASQVFGKNLLLYDRSECKNIKVWLAILFLTPLFASLIGHLFALIDRRASMTSYKMSSYKVFFLYWALIFVLWLPVLFVAYPGVYGYDCVYQINYCKAEMINLKHPIAHSLMLYFFVIRLGDQVFHDKEFGYFLYSILQMLILSGSMAYSIKYLVRKGVPRWFLVTVLVLFALLPVNPIMGMSSTKDVLYAAFGLVYTVLLLEILEAKKISKLNVVLMAIALLLTMTFRSQGFYVFIAMVPVVLFLLKGKRVKTLILAIVITIVYLLYSGPFTTKVLHGIKYDYSKQEYFSVPCMQLMRVFHNEEGALSTDQAQKIASYIPNYEYDGAHGVADPYKNGMDVTSISEAPMEFAKLWWDVGVNNSVDYIDAWGRLTIGLWYSDMNYWDIGSWHYYWEYDMVRENPEVFDILERRTPPALQGMSDLYREWSNENTYQKIPLVPLLVSSGVYFWCIVLFGVWCVIKKKHQYLIIAAYPVIYWLTMLLGPVVLYRYVYILALIIPIMFGVMITAASDKQRASED
ncbi:hypothetical protein SAMN05216413_2528 [Ruminococcaceae bacterium KH2T8]|nr:hypothetical protein SAMN05216413_2528 [Ruminococcaceae bacterium KH2T8]